MLQPPRRVADETPPAQPIKAYVPPDDADAAPERGADDAEAVAAVLDGDVARFEQLVDKYQRQAVVVSYRLLGNTEDARDVTQDAFVKAYRSLDTLERPAAFGGWLLRIVTNLSLNYRRGRKHRTAQPLDGPVGEQLGSPTATHKPMRGHNPDSMTRPSSPLATLEGRELGEELRRAVAKLPDKQRQALILFTVEEMPQKEVAQQLACSVEAVKWHVFQARKKLRDLLKDTM